MSPRDDARGPVTARPLPPLRSAQIARARGLLVGLTLGLAALGLGCGPYLSALTAPPPTLQAELDGLRDRIDLSAGVALAFSCTSWEGLPCRNAKIVSDDPTIAEAFPAHLNQLTPDYPFFPGARRGPRAPTGFVVVGHQAGSTRLRLTSTDGDLELAVQVAP